MFRRMLIGFAATLLPANPTILHALQTPNNYVSSFVLALPGREFDETVVTLSAEPVKVIVAHMPDGDIARELSYFLRPAREKINPAYAVVYQTEVPVERHVANGFEHKIAIPPQHPGLYEISLASKERSAVQDLAVSTLGVIADFEASGAVLLPLDTRTMRRRSDVTLTGYASTQRQTYRPAPDGLIHLKNEFGGTNLPDWPLGKLILTASDGSIIPMNYLIALPSKPRVYLDTERAVYRVGQRINYAFILHEPTPDEKMTLSLSGPGTNIDRQIDAGERITTGALGIPQDAGGGVYTIALGQRFIPVSVVDARTSKYGINMRATKPHLAVGETAVFAMSVRTLDGLPAGGVRVPYAWHFRPFGIGPIPLAFYLAGDPQLTRAELTTDSDGNGTIEIQTPKSHPTPIELIAYDPTDRNLPLAMGVADTNTASPHTIETEQNVVPISAHALEDGDAIVRYGTPPNLYWRVVPFQDGRAKFALSLPSDEDSVPVSIKGYVGQPEQKLIERKGAPHRLRVTLSCSQRVYRDGQPLHICIRVRDFRNRPVQSNVTISVTEATEADIRAAQGRSDAAYHDLYAPRGEEAMFYSTFDQWKREPPVSYLFPESPREYGAVAAFALLGNSLRQPEASGSEPNVPPQTIYWLDQVASGKNGSLGIQLPWPLAARPGLYAIHVTSIAKHGEVGQAFEFVEYHP